MNLFSTALYAMGQPPAQNASAQSGGAAFMGMLFPLIIVFGIFYLLVFRPQKKQQKLHQEMLNNLKKGDKILTSSGIFGQVSNIDNNIITIKVDENVKMKILKSYIVKVVEDEKKVE